VFPAPEHGPIGGPREGTDQSEHESGKAEIAFAVFFFLVRMLVFLLVIVISDPIKLGT